MGCRGQTLRTSHDAGPWALPHFRSERCQFSWRVAAEVPRRVARRSFAAYYYTHELPPAGIRNVHGTVFRARPDERLRELVLMPAEQAQRAVFETVKTVRRGARRLASRVIRRQ